VKPHNWRVFAQFRKLRRFLTPGLLAHMPAIPRPTYCARCKGWTWCTAEVPALSTRPLFICHDCADENDEESDAAWRAFCNW
jgi:hypothetical protein